MPPKAHYDYAPDGGCGFNRCNNGWYTWSGTEYPCGACTKLTAAHKATVENTEEDTVSKVWTENEIVELVTGSDTAAMRAVLAVWKRQTEDEKSSHTTRHDNTVGFSQADAGHGTSMARWMMGFGWNTGTTMTEAAEDGTMRRKIGGACKRAGGTMSRMDLCRKLAVKYRRQLMEIANGS